MRTMQITLVGLCHVFIQELDKTSMYILKSSHADDMPEILLVILMLNTLGSCRQRITMESSAFLSCNQFLAGMPVGLWTYWMPSVSFCCS